MKLVLLLLLLLTCSIAQQQVNQCVLRCKDNHMREMDNEWSTDFTLPVLSLVQKTGNETAAFIRFHEICQSNQLLEGCLQKCNKSIESDILLAGSKSWEYSCSHVEDIKSQFSCWMNHGEQITNACRMHTVHLRNSMLQFTKNQSQQYMEHICSDFDNFSTCLTLEHSRLCGQRAEMITGRMFHNNREAMYMMLKMKWPVLPPQCGYSNLRRDTYSRYASYSTNFFHSFVVVVYLLSHLV